MTSGVPQRSIVGIVLFDVFVSDIDSRAECNPSRFSHETMMSGAVDVDDGQDASQSGIGKLEKWTCVNIMRFNEAKYEVLHLG